MPLIDPKTQLDLLPENPGVYKMQDAAGKLLYVGKAKNLAKRVRGYFEGRTHGPHIDVMVPQIESIDITITASENDALLLEQSLIHAEKPKYNIIFRDDKTYPYILLSGGPAPRLSIERGRVATQGAFGPFADGKQARVLLEQTQKIFRLRTCDDASFSGRTRPCVLHQIGRCSAPCMPGLADGYPDAVRLARKFLSGESKELLSDLQALMDSQSRSLDFESAAKTRDQIRALSLAAQGQTMEARSGASLRDMDVLALAAGDGRGRYHWLRARGGHVVESRGGTFVAPNALPPDEILASFVSFFYLDRLRPDVLVCPPALAAGMEQIEGIVLDSSPSGQAKRWLDLCSKNAASSLSARNLGDQRERVEDCVAMLGLSQAPRRVDCFDISHLQGEAPKASQRVWVDGGSSAELSRIHSISPASAANDPASIREAVIKAYNGLLPDEWPDLVLIDGARPQVDAALSAAAALGASSVRFLGLSKGPERKTGAETLVPSWAESFSPGPRPGLLFLASIRDQSHDSSKAASGRALRKKRSESLLASIPGVGPTRRTALLLAFGSARGCSQASVEQLAAVPGISFKLAECIKSALSKEEGL